MKAIGLRFICYSRNVMFRVDTASGPYALRIDVDTERSLSDVRSELTWLQTIHRHLSMTVPVPNPARNGELIQRMKAPDLGLEATAVLFSWIEGDPMYGSVPPERMEELGEMIARMHAHGSEFEPPTSFHLPTWRPDMVHYWLGLQQIPEGLTYDRFQQIKRAATWAASEYSTVRSALGTGIIHNDLSGQNLIVRSTDIAAIDLEACSIGPFVQDLAMTLTYFTDRADLNELRNAVVKGYLKLRRLNKVELRSFELFYVLNALRDLREIFTWPRLTFKSWGPDVLETSLRQLERYQHLFSTEEETLLLAH